MKPEVTHWRWFYTAAALEAGAAFFILMGVPHTGSGFSLTRLGMLAVLLAFFLTGTYLAIRSPHGSRQALKPGFALASCLLALALATILFLLRYLDPGRTLVIYERIGPLLFYLMLLAFQTSLFALVIRYGFHFDRYSQGGNFAVPALLSFAILLFAFLFISITMTGLTPDSAYWGEPGVPIMGWQFVLAILAGSIVMLASLQATSSSKLIPVLPIAIWLFAIAIWLNVPTSVMQNSFYAPMNPPTGQPFPNSDAGYYDSMAHSLLTGYPYLGDIPTRPLYIVLLASLHKLAGEQYGLIIAGQTLLLGLIPVLLFFLGKKLHSPTAGVIVALFAIFREWTSLLISSQTRVSNTKTLLVDLPTLLLILAAGLFMLRWLERRDWKSGLTAGGMFGILLLLRTQSMIILPVLFVTAILSFGLHNRSWMPALAFFLAGFAVTITPWLLHNYLRTGQFTFDAPFEYQVIASQYKYTGNLDLGSVDLQGKTLFGILMTFVIKDPKFVLGFIASHFFATQINGLLALPLIEKYNGVSAPINLYWMTWDGSLSLANAALLILYLAVIAIGLGAAWRRWRWMGLVPLAFSIGYSLANGIGRFSGWRYDLPADWLAYFYFGIGAAEILAAAAMGFGAMPEKIFTTISNTPPADLKRAQGSWLTGLVMCAFIVTGALPWMAEGMAPPRFAGQTAARLLTALSDSSSVRDLGADRTQIETFAASPQTALMIGQVLYPRFFTRSLGLASSHPWPAYAPRDFPRMGFLLINQARNDLVLPAHTIPDPFPEAADAIVLGCRRADYIEVRLMLFPDTNSAYLSMPLSVPCN